MKHLLKKHRMLSVGIFLAAVLSIIYAAILSPAGNGGLFRLGDTGLGSSQQLLLPCLGKVRHIV